jgi:sugar O-acyltransferase (sialic acid O-acetyltransferase NeuD family)
MKLYGIVGAGGFGRGVMPIARHWLPIWDGEGESEAVFVVEDHCPIPAPVVNGHRVLSMTQFLAAPASARKFNIAIADSSVRERVAGRIKGVAEPFPMVAPSHLSYDGNKVGEGAILCAFSHINSNVSVGRFFHCNSYSYVEHDCVIGDFVTFAPGVKCNGRVVIEDHAYIGAGAVIKDATNGPIVIGRGAVVGMGAVVTKSVPAGATVLGNPARIRA